ncbi:uncharacterized protein DS421_12g370660 [Arachis hypogaea]|nr:uncharacterized protein DS421_12g370660 [Arachis hypogaea]
MKERKKEGNREGRSERGERRWRCRAIIADRRCRCVLLFAPPPPSRKLPLLLAVAVEIARRDGSRVKGSRRLGTATPSSPLLAFPVTATVPATKSVAIAAAVNVVLPLLSPAILIKSAASEASGRDFWPHLCRRRALLPPKTAFEACVCWKLPPEPLSSWFGFRYLRVEIKVVIEPPELRGVPELPPDRYFPPAGALFLVKSVVAAILDAAVDIV